MDIYRIVDRYTNEEVGVYMQPTARDEYNFSSVESARRSNCHGIYEDKAKYKIRKYKLVLVDDDCDPATEEEIEAAKKEQERAEAHKELVRKCCDEIALEQHGKPYDELEVADQFGIYVLALSRASMKEYVDAAILG